MSGIVALLDGAGPPDVALGRTMLQALTRPVPGATPPASGGPGEPTTLWHDDRVLLGVARLEWEWGDDFSGPVGVLVEGDLCVAADASIYHRADLRRRLAARGVAVGGPTASHLIAAAYRAWGTDCPAHLDGDFAFVLWDGARRRAMCARDFVGRRALYHARCGDTLVVASTVRGVLAHPGCSHALNPAAIGATAAGLLWSAGSDSCYRDVHVLAAAHTLVWSPAASPGRPTPHWRPPVRDPGAPIAPLAEAAEELRALLESAVTERAAGAGVTAVWMSGGWDSTAVMGAGIAALGDSEHSEPCARPRGLRPVSISYPRGDPGREDDIIADVADFCGVDVHWLDIADIPMFDGLAELAAATDEPPAHLYELWNRALARGTRACGARIALDGSGGDQLFQVSDIYLSDLLRRGHWRRLAGELRVRRARGYRHMFRNTIEPNLPLAATRLTGRLSGSVGRHYMEHPAAPWIRPDFLAAHHLAERERAFLPPRHAPDRADAENRSFLTAPIWSWGGSYMTGVFLEEGVETRSPLLDRRIVEFALRRPVEERANGRETKRLLRRAVHGLLPDHVLAPRPFRTGVTLGYSRRQMRAHYPALFANLFRSELRLAAMGIVDPAMLRQAVHDSVEERGSEFDRVALFHTLKTELWLRAREYGEVPGRKQSVPPMGALDTGLPPIGDVAPSR